MTRLVFLALLAASIAGCGGRSTDLPIHLVDDPKIRHDDPSLAWGEIVFLDGVPRQVLSSSVPVLPPSELLPQADGTRKIRAQIPQSFGALPWLSYEIVAKRGDTMRMLRAWPVIGSLAGKTHEIALPEARIQPDETPAVRLWPIPDLANRDVETGDVVVPPHTALELGVGIEPITWDAMILPLDMTVTAVAAGGATTALKTIRLDPPRTKTNQKWVDATIPLDALAGQTVRFRFTARPSVGPSARPVLPLWADPTIVEAPTAPAAES